MSDRLMSADDLEAIAKLAYGGGEGDPQRDVRRLLMHIDALTEMKCIVPDGYVLLKEKIYWDLMAGNNKPYVLALQYRAITGAKP